MISSGSRGRVLPARRRAGSAVASTCSGTTLFVRLLDPKTGQLLREHVRAPRGWHRIADADRPRRTPPKTIALCGRASSPNAQGRGFAAVSRRPRRCSCRRQNLRSAPASTSRPVQLIAGFEVSINCRFWVSTEVHEDSAPASISTGRGRAKAIAGVPSGASITEGPPPLHASTASGMRCARGGCDRQRNRCCRAKERCVDLTHDRSGRGMYGGSVTAALGLILLLRPWRLPDQASRELSALVAATLLGLLFLRLCLPV
jgi:hypothetical protein